MSSLSIGSGNFGKKEIRPVSVQSEEKKRKREENRTSDVFQSCLSDRSNSYNSLSVKKIRTSQESRGFGSSSFSISGERSYGQTPSEEVDSLISNSSLRTTEEGSFASISPFSKRVVETPTSPMAFSSIGNRFSPVPFYTQSPQGIVRPLIASLNTAFSKVRESSNKANVSMQSSMGCFNSPQIESSAQSENLSPGLSPFLRPGILEGLDLPKFSGLNWRETDRNCDSDEESPNASVEDVADSDAESTSSQEDNASERPCYSVNSERMFSSSSRAFYHDEEKSESTIDLSIEDMIKYLQKDIFY